MKLKPALMLMLITGCGVQAADSWSISYGRENGQVAVFNSNTDKTFKEDQPFGPMSFRICKNDLWVLDSIGGKIHQFDGQNKLKKSFMLSGMPENLVLEDFALNSGSTGDPESVWVAEAATCEVKKISLANGKELVKVGGNGNEPGKFLQINQIEVDRTGRVYVGDIGRSVIAVFTPYGELVREISWQRCGFAFDPSNRMHTLQYEENAGYFIKVFSSKGQLEKSLHLGMAELTNPRVWAVAGNGNIVVSFVPAGGFKGTLKLMEITPFGRVARSMEFEPPAVMNRYLAGTEGIVWLAEADFEKAPAGQFAVKSMSWGERK